MNRSIPVRQVLPALFAAALATALRPGVPRPSTSVSGTGAIFEVGSGRSVYIPMKETRR